MVSLKEFVNQRKAVNAKIVEQIAGALQSIEEYCGGARKGGDLCNLIDECMKDIKSTRCQASVTKWADLTEMQVNAMLNALNNDAIQEIGEKLGMITGESFNNWKMKATSNIGGNHVKKYNPQSVRKLELIFNKVNSLTGKAPVPRSRLSVRPGIPSKLPTKTRDPVSVMTSVTSTGKKEKWEKYFSQDRKAAFQAKLASAQAKAERLSSIILSLGGGSMFGGAVALGPQDDVVSALAKLANEKDIHMGALIENLVKEMKELLAAKGKQLSGDSEKQLTEAISDLKNAENEVYTLADILVYAAKKSVKGEKIPEYEDNKLKLSEHLRTKINEALEKKVNNNVKEYRKIFNALTGLFNNAFLVM